MSSKKWFNPPMAVRLTREQRENLENFAAAGTNSAPSIRRARALLLLDLGAPGEALTFDEMSVAVGFTVRALREIRRRFNSLGLDSVMERKTRETPPHMPFDHGALEKQVLAVVCGRPPMELTHWSLRLIQRKLVDDGVVKTISPPTVNKMLRNLNVSLNATPCEIKRQARERGLLPRGVQIGKGEPSPVKIKQYAADPRRNIRHVRIVDQRTQGA